MNRHLDRLHEANNNLFSGIMKSDEPTCCFCIPIRIGIILIGLISLFDCFQFVMLANNIADVSMIVMIFYYIALIPAAVGFLIFVQYFLKDTTQNRKYLQDACGLMILAEVIAYTGMVVGAILSDQIPTQNILTFIPINGLNALFYFMFRMICK